MFNEKSIKTVNKSKFSKCFTKPLYESYCFSNIPGTIKNLLTNENNTSLPDDVLTGLSKNYKKVVFFFVDAFGWSFFERYADKYKSLEEFVDNGVVSKITSQFPSTTSAHVTSIHTGVPVNKSGVYEWYYYDPEVDSVIASLPFSLAEDYEPETLRKLNVDPRKMFPTTTIYNELKKHNIKSYTFNPAAICNSTFSNLTLNGSTPIGYNSTIDCLSMLTESLLNNKEKAYYFAYFPDIDSMGHAYGIHSEEFEREVDKFFTALDKFFFSVLKGNLKDTLFILSADHGQTSVDLNRTVFLNDKFKNILDYIKTNNASKPIVPAGSFRDMFLHIKDDCVNQVIDILKPELEGIAQVYKTEDFINDSMFGLGKPSQAFIDRVGNIVIVPYKDESVWWYDKDKYSMKFLGAHGGLTKEEMEIPFLAYEFK